MSRNPHGVSQVKQSLSQNGAPQQGSISTAYAAKKNDISRATEKSTPKLLRRYWQLRGEEQFQDMLSVFSAHSNGFCAEFAVADNAFRCYLLAMILKLCDLFLWTAGSKHMGTLNNISPLCQLGITRITLCKQIDTTEPRAIVVISQFYLKLMR